jgi:hypothetical protein
MCNAVVSMSRRKDVPLEYSVIWSPKLKVSPDVAPSQPILLSEPSYDHLEYAAKKLRELKFDRAVVRGLVIGLSSRDAPLGTRPTERSVVVRWTDRPDGRPINVIVPLGKDQYVLAHKAHLEWSYVEVTGILRHIATIWRLSEPSGFRVLR